MKPAPTPTHTHTHYINRLKSLGQPLRTVSTHHCVHIRFSRQSLRIIQQPHEKITLCPTVASMFQNALQQDMLA